MSKRSLNSRAPSSGNDRDKLLELVTIQEDCGGVVIHSTRGNVFLD